MTKVQTVEELKYEIRVWRSHVQKAFEDLKKGKASSVIIRLGDLLNGKLKVP